MFFAAVFTSQHVEAVNKNDFSVAVFTSQHVEAVNKNDFSPRFSAYKQACRTC